MIVWKLRHNQGILNKQQTYIDADMARIVSKYGYNFGSIQTCPFVITVFGSAIEYIDQILLCLRAAVAGIKHQYTEI